MAKETRNGKRRVTGSNHSREHMLMLRGRNPAPALRHGGTVRLTGEEIGGACAEVRQIAPWLSQPRYSIALEQLARLLARVKVMDGIIARHPKGWVVKATASGRMFPNPGEKYYLGVTEQIRRLLNDLGLTPQACKTLGFNVESPDEKDLATFLRDAAEDGS